MRTIPSALQTRLESGVTTLCRCWRVTRRDGVTQGFTDHDCDIAFDSVTYRAATGLSAAEATQQLGLAVTSTDIGGALSADTLNEDDLAAGRYDAATIEVFLCDWSDPSLRILLSRGVFGEVRRDGKAFVAEMRGLADRLSQESGRLYTAGCAADLGDARCTINLGDPLFRADGTVSALAGTSRFEATGLSDFDAGWFTAGRLLWTTGDNSGLAVEVKRHAVEAEVAIVELWQAMPQPLAAGDTFTVTAGCDKRFETCRDRFDNALNFRGFPHIPGNDFLIRYPVSGEPGHDGGPLV